ncbi:MAG: response regulator [Patescibacteria group bacterium]|nr:response regulator [Patescibacteria group bacterium]
MAKKILIIEDEEALSGVLSSKLKKNGFEALIAVDGEDGLKKIEEWKPDLILLDIVMPKINGYEVLEELQKKGNKIPVIIISNSGQEIELEKTKKLGAADCIVKTQLDPEEVIEKVKNFLGISVKKDDKGEKEDVKKEEEEENDGARVLLVEDDLFLRDICYKKLKKEGFNVLMTVNGEDAIKKIDDFKPEIVLLDIILPVMDGFEVLKKIRSNSNSAIKKVPVIMFSNLGQKEDIQKALDLGADDYLVKAHFTTEEIISKVKSKLGI